MVHGTPYCSELPAATETHGIFSLSPMECTEQHTFRSMWTFCAKMSQAQKHHAGRLQAGDGEVEALIAGDAMVMPSVLQFQTVIDPKTGGNQ